MHRQKKPVTTSAAMMSVAVCLRGGFIFYRDTREESSSFLSRSGWRLYKSYATLDYVLADEHIGSNQPSVNDNSAAVSLFYLKPILTIHTKTSVAMYPACNHIHEFLVNTLHAGYMEWSVLHKSYS